MSAPLEQLPGRLSPCKGHSKTKPSAPRTFADILPWEGCVDEAGELAASLNDQDQRYQHSHISIRPGASIPAAADESEVRGCIMHMLYGLSQAAEDLGWTMEFVGGGSGRSTSFMDVVVRVRAAQGSASSRIAGAGEVKGSWQFLLARGETLNSLLHDPKQLDGFILGLQQASDLPVTMIIGVCVMQLVFWMGFQHAS